MFERRYDLNKIRDYKYKEDLDGDKYVEVYEYGEYYFKIDEDKLDLILDTPIYKLENKFTKYTNLVYCSKKYKKKLILKYLLFNDEYKYKEIIYSKFKNGDRTDFRKKNIVFEKLTEDKNRYFKNYMRNVRSNDFEDGYYEHTMKFFVTYLNNLYNKNLKLENLKSIKILPDFYELFKGLGNKKLYRKIIKGIIYYYFFDDDRILYKNLKLRDKCNYKNFNELYEFCKNNIKNRKKFDNNNCWY